MVIIMMLNLLTLTTEENKRKGRERIRSKICKRAK
jgi:hypothetical protein